MSTRSTNHPRFARLSLTAATGENVAMPAEPEWVTLTSPAELPAAAESQTFEVLVIPEDAAGASGWREEARRWVSGVGAEAPIRAASRHCAVVWRYGRATICGPAEWLTPALAVVIDLQRGEGVLRELEAGVREAWADVTRDRALAYEVRASDRAAFPEVGRRMAAVLGLRLRFAREQARWRNGRPAETEFERDLGDELREAQGWEERVEVLDDQLETQEGIYELASQRIGEYRHAREGFVIEWIIVGLLALESVMILWDLWGRHT